MQLTDVQRDIAIKYGHLFHNTGGNDVAELVERKGVTLFNNVIVAVMQSCCLSQIQLIQRLQQEGMLKEVQGG